MATKATKPRSRRSRGAADLLVPLDRTQQTLQEQARALLAADGLALARRVAETSVGNDDTLWEQLASLEWLGILVPEEHGGAGGSLLDACVILEEAGRALLPLPYLATAIFGAVGARTSPTDLAALARGEARATAAPGSTITVVDGAVPQATGTATSVLEADVANLIVLGAVDENELPLAVRTGPAEGARVTPLPSVDPTRALCTVELDATPVMILARGEEAVTLLQDTQASGSVGLAAELAGAAARCVELTVEHAKARVQFGKPIGTYQAVKHRCVDAFIAVEAARAGVRHAARLVDAGDPSRHVVAAFARINANRALSTAAQTAIQLHGGAGYTWDNDAHFYLKRAKASEHVLGAPSSPRRAIAEAFGI